MNLNLRKSFTLIFSGICLSSSGLAVSAACDTALFSQNFTEALKVCQEPASASDPWVQFQLGYMYANGLGTPQDDVKAFSWLKLSAEKGNTNAQTLLARLHLEGNSIPRNPQLARQLLENSARAEDGEAQTLLGLMYLEAWGVSKDEKTAFDLLTRAADQGMVYAQSLLGYMHESGRGAPQSDAQAVKWYQKAAEQGDPSAQYALWAMYNTGRGVTQDPAMAQQYFQKAEAQQAAEGLYWMGKRYLVGLGVEKNPALSADYLQKAADLGDGLASLSLASVPVRLEVKSPDAKQTLFGKQLTLELALDHPVQGLTPQVTVNNVKVNAQPLSSLAGRVQNFSLSVPLPENTLAYVVEVSATTGAGASVKTVRTIYKGSQVEPEPTLAILSPAPNTSIEDQQVQLKVGSNVSLQGATLQVTVNGQRVSPSSLQIAGTRAEFYVDLPEGTAPSQIQVKTVTASGKTSSLASVQVSRRTMEATVDPPVKPVTVSTTGFSVLAPGPDASLTPNKTFLLRLKVDAPFAAATPVKVQLGDNVIGAGKFNAGEAVMSLTTQAVPDGLSGKQTLTVTVGTQQKTLQVNVPAPARTTKPTKPNLYFVGIAVTDFQANKVLPSLTYTSADVAALADFFTNTGDTFWGKQHIRELYDDNATYQNVMGAFNDLVNERPKPEDTVVLFISSHGMPVYATPESNLPIFYAALYDTVLPNKLPYLKDQVKNGLSDNDIAGMVKNLPSNTIIILDTCFSGAVSRSTIAKAVKDPKATAIISLSTSETLQSVVRESKNRVILSSTDAESVSYEDEKWKHGAFTFALLEELKLAKEKPTRTINSLMANVMEEVSQMTQGEQQGPQLPDLFGDKFMYLFPQNR